MTGAMNEGMENRNSAVALSYADKGKAPGEPHWR